MVQHIFCCILAIGSLDYKLWFSIFFTVFLLLVHWTTNYGSVYFLLYFDHWFIELQTMVQYIFAVF